MAQIYVFGHVENDLVPQTSQKGSTYVCFYLKERTGKGRFQSYQVWAWEEDVFRLLNGKVHKGSFIWLTGTQELVDCTADQGKTKTKRLKVYCAASYIPKAIPSGKDVLVSVPVMRPPPISTSENAGTFAAPSSNAA